MHCTWNSWASWGSCSKTCGSGTRTRSRSKNGPYHGGTDCSGSSSSSATCNTNACYKLNTWSTAPLGSCSRVKSMSECETAARALGLSDTTVTNDGENWSSDPPYCYFEGGALKYNPGRNTGSCSGSDVCICNNL